MSSEITSADSSLLSSLTFLATHHSKKHQQHQRAGRRAGLTVRVLLPLLLVLMAFAVTAAVTAYLSRSADHTQTTVTIIRKMPRDADYLDGAASAAAATVSELLAEAAEEEAEAAGPGDDDSLSSYRLHVSATAPAGPSAGAAHVGSASGGGMQHVELKWPVYEFIQQELKPLTAASSDASTSSSAAAATTTTTMSNSSSKSASGSSAAVSSSATSRSATTVSSTSSTTPGTDKTKQTSQSSSQLPTSAHMRLRGNFSVVIMNWSRPQNTLKILDAYTTDPAYGSLVSEVIVVHLRPQSAFNYTSPKVKHYQDYTANAKYGLAVRFLGCLLASETEVILQDDDVLIRPSGMLDLFAARAAADHLGQLVAFRGRDWNRTQEPGYNRVEPRPGLHPVALTIALATHRSMCAAFFKYAPAVEDLVQGSVPYWNGEDIFLSLVSYKLTCTMPRILPGGWPEETANALYYFPDQADVGMHKVYESSHFAHRKRFLRVASKRLGIYRPGRQAQDACGTSTTSKVRPAY